LAGYSSLNAPASPPACRGMMSLHLSRGLRTALSLASSPVAILGALTLNADVPRQCPGDRRLAGGGVMAARIMRRNPSPKSGGTIAQIAPNRQSSPRGPPRQKAELSCCSDRRPFCGLIRSAWRNTLIYQACRSATMSAPARAC
jgi:hypothetical protein